MTYEWTSLLPGGWQISVEYVIVYVPIYDELDFVGMQLSDFETIMWHEPLNAEPLKYEI